MKQRENDTLGGRRIVVPESRELDRFSAMLETYGATVLRCPLILVRPLDETSALDSWLERLIAGDHDWLAFYTGEGVTHITARAEQLGRLEEAVTAFANARKIARGPKPGAALRKLGLAPELLTQAPTTEGLLTTFEKLPLRGTCVGVQLYPGAPTDLLSEALHELGAEFDPILPYRYDSDEHDDEVASMILEMMNGRVDLIAFTSKLQVQRLLEVAERKGLATHLKHSLEAITIAAVGPVAARAVEEAGGTVQVQPASSFHLKPLVREIVRAFRPRG